MKSSRPSPETLPRVEDFILTLRGQKVILDSDLAALYQTTTKRLNEQVKRNLDRFPADFMFQLTKEENKQMRTGVPAQNSGISTDNESLVSIRSQTATFKSPARSKRLPKYPPRAFTEHGAIMAATLLNSQEAVAMSVYVVRAFVQMREHISANAEVLKRLAEIDKTLLKHDKSLQIIWHQLQPLLDPPPSPPKRRIGFHP